MNRRGNPRLRRAQLVPTLRNNKFVGGQVLSGSITGGRCNPASHCRRGATCSGRERLAAPWPTAKPWAASIDLNQDPWPVGVVLFISEKEIAMKAEDVMTRNVISVDPNATVLHAARLMLQHHISGLPVIDSTGKLVGILSRRRFSPPPRDPHRAPAFALARISDGARPHRRRIHPFARQQGVRGDEHRRGVGHRSDAARRHRRTDGAPPRQACAGAVRRRGWSALSPAPILCMPWSAWGASRRPASDRRRHHPRATARRNAEGKMGAGCDDQCRGA